MLLIYTHHITPRVQYIFDYILKSICGFKISLTQDVTTYTNFSGPTLNYSHKLLKEDDFNIKPSGFLFSKSIEPFKITFDKKEDSVKMYIESEHSDSKIFDPFAAAFFLVSRYEEYLPFSADEHQRFEASSSVLFQNGLLERPLVNEWADQLKAQLLSKVPIEHKQNKFSGLITIDVDQAFAFKNRGIKQNVFSFFNNIFHHKKTLFQAQKETLFKKGDDPYDTFELLRDAQKTFSKPFIYFINVGRKTKFDKNLPHKNKEFKDLVKRIKSYAPVGLHPSYYSNEDPRKFVKEKAALEFLVEDEVVISRQHYLKLNLPYTYQFLLLSGFKKDYSMGFATQPGFRSGTCTPFFWFDVENNHITNLKVYPITYMEGTLAEDLKLSPKEAWIKIKELTDTVKKHNGTFISVWHNHTVNDQFFWKGWKAIFDKSLQYINFLQG